MSFHSEEILQIHAVIGLDVIYSTIAARDADTAFTGSSANRNKMVRVEDADGFGNTGYFILISNAPAWTEAIGVVPPIQVKELAVDYTVLITDDVVVGAAAGLNFTLPPLSAVFKQVNIKCMLLLGATIAITGDSGETIEGSASLNIASSSAVTLIPTTTGWMII